MNISSQLPKFRLYTGYCHAQAESDRYVKELRKNNKAFNNFLEVNTLISTLSLH